jgi:hypothetical protein
MRAFVYLMLLSSVACATISPASASPEVQEWRTATGKPPSKSEFAAVIAACEDRAKSSSTNSPIEGCLADYGLSRAQ